MKIPTLGKIVTVRGRNGAMDFVLVVEIPHGKRTRTIEVPIEPLQILALADVLNCCPEHIMRVPSTDRRGPGEIHANIGHAVWHLENPDRPRPCLPDGGAVLDTTEALPVLEAHVADDDDCCHYGRWLLGKGK